MSILLTPSQIEQIQGEGVAAYPNECCGALLGRDEACDRRVVRLEPMLNSFVAGEQFHRFSLDPKEFIKIEKLASAEKLSVLGFYHSHPDHPARPSEYDRVHAWPYYSYIIIAIERSKPALMTSWKLDENTEQFVSEEIVQLQSQARGSVP